ncbi:MAG: AAA family ATPase [Clostridia bacterium]|nr:AAA family ATPase [Clostridia bacterium]
MKIVSLQIQSFGKLQNVQLDLTNGINIIQQQNGFGKTTVANFVRAMLYGFTYKTRVQADGSRNNDAQDFLPWNTDKLFGGSMVVEHQGVLYRIERFFGKKSAQERLSVFNQSTSSPVKIDVPLGEYFLGLSAESYDRSVYIPQEAVVMTSNDNIDKQLAGLVENGAQDFEKVMDNLRDYKRYFRYERGRGGEIPRLEDQAYNLQLQLQQIAQNKVAKQQRQQQVQQIADELVQIDKQQQALQGKLEQLSNNLPSQTVDQAQVVAKQRVADLKLEIASLPPEVDKDVELAQKLATDLQQDAPTTKQSAPKWPLVLAMVFCAAAIALFVVWKPLTIGLAVVLALLGGLTTVVYAKMRANATKQARQSVQQFEQQQATFKQQLQTLASKYNVKVENLQQVPQSIASVAYQRQSNIRIVAELEKTILPTTDAVGYQQISLQIDQTKAQISNLQSRRMQLVVEKTRLEASIQTLVVDGVEVAEQLAQTNHAIQQSQHKWDVADKVMQLLTQAKTNLSTSYLPNLCNTCGAFLSAVAGKTYKVVADKKFNIWLEEDGAMHLLECFSRGTKEMVMFCFRLALSQLLFGGGIPLLVVDDAFVNFDEENFQRATQLLSKLSNNTQVVYFTCQQRLGALA